MKRESQNQLLRELFGYLDTRSTARIDTMMRNPVAAYTDQDWLEHERKTLFTQHPQFAGLTGQLAKPGDYYTQMFGTMPVLLVRDRDGKAKAFANVCRHRGSPIAQGCGTARAFSCPYHGWSYGLDGRLLSVTDEKGFAGIDKDQHHLVRLKSGEKYGMIFVQPQPVKDGESPELDVDKHLGGIAEEVAPFHLENYSLFRTEVLRPAMNWKFVIDTFLEAYHIAFLHKETVSPIFHGNVSAAAKYGLHGRMAALRRSSKELHDKPENEWGEALKHVIVLYQLFPNAMFIYQADHVETWRVFPGAKPDECVAEFSLYTPTPAESDKARKYWNANFDLATRTVRDEDFTVGAEMQKGFASGAQSHVTYGRNEPALIHFHRSIRRALGLSEI
jgi:phenylpropionate dioxygenase-like ring-hydroxylating dioxygenase large terminal subunit